MKNRNLSKSHCKIQKAIKLSSGHDKKQALEPFKKLGKHKKERQSNWTQIFDHPLLGGDCKIILRRGNTCGAYDHYNDDMYSDMRLPVDFIFQPGKVFIFQSCLSEGEEEIFVVPDEEIGMTFIVEADLCELAADESFSSAIVH